MPRTQITNGQLRALEQDIINQQRTSAAFFFFNRARVERFFSQNQFALKVMNTRLMDFVKQYVKHDENNQACTEEKDGELHFVFSTDENKEKYSAAVANFLKLKTTIEI